MVSPERPPRKPSKKASPLLGAHMSIQGGAHRAIERGQALGCTAIQMFTRNNIQWRAKPLTGDDVQRFRDAWAASAMGPLVAHANYLIDLASDDERVVRLSLDGLVVEFRRAAALGIPWVVLHPGCHKGAGEEAGLWQIAEMAARALDATSDLPVGLLLETTAGQGTALGYRFEQLAWLLGAIEPRGRVGVCFDTCHVFTAGYDIRTARGYRAVMREFDRVVGIDQIHALHVNDSKAELGSRVDRHEHIGRGKLGFAPFRRLMRDRRLARVPKLLETPKADNRRKEWDAINLATLRRLA